MASYEYSRESFVRFAARLVADGRWTEDDAATYIRQYDDETLKIKALPLEPGAEGPRLVDMLRGMKGLPEL